MYVRKTFGSVVATAPYTQWELRVRDETRNKFYGFRTAHNVRTNDLTTEAAHR